MSDQVRTILHELIVASPATRDEGIEPTNVKSYSHKLRTLSMPPATMHRIFTIRAADENGQRSEARILVNRLYTERGYLSTYSPVPSGQPVSPRPEPAITLVVQEQDTIVGTLSIGVDGPQGLLVDELYATEARTLRDQGHKLCEFIKLGVDQIARSRRLLASLFHTAFLYATEVHKCDHVVVEVNPRHVDFYRRILGFTVIGPERSNPRVDAPAVLMCLDLQHTQAELQRPQDSDDRAAVWLYKNGFSDKEKEGIVRRMREAFGHHSSADFNTTPGAG